MLRHRIGPIAMGANAEDGIAQRRGIDGTGGSQTMQWMRSRDPADVKFGNLGSIQQAIRSFCRSETTMRPENRHNASFRGGCIRTRHRASDGFYRKDAKMRKGKKGGHRENRSLKRKRRNFWIDR